MQKLVFATPGNPVSSIVTSILFAVPALKKLAGHRSYFLPEIQVKVFKTSLPFYVILDHLISLLTQCDLTNTAQNFIEQRSSGISLKVCIASIVAVWFPKTNWADNNLNYSTSQSRRFICCHRNWQANKQPSAKHEKCQCTVEITAG